MTPDPSSPPRLAVVLAAGLGKRMRSELPKVLHEAAGRPLLAWVLDAARAAGCRRIVVVVGHGADRVRAAFPDPDLEWAVQAEQLGTGHALAQAAPFLGAPATVLVLSGDVPLVTPATLERLAEAAPGSLGRVLEDGRGGLAAIVEARDATPDELAVRTVNAGLYALPAPAILGYLAELRPDNAQGELYLTDAVTAAARAGHRIELVRLADPDEALGVNDRDELARIDRRLAERRAAAPAGARP